MSHKLVKIEDKSSLDFFRVKSEKVEKVDVGILQLINDMFSVLYKNDAIGLAAVMVGVHKRVVVVDLQENNRKKPLTLINPEIIEHSKEEEEGEEASISIDGVREKIFRYKTIKVRYFDDSMKERIIEASGLLSVCLQHEIDYLNAVLFVDHLPEDKRNQILTKLINNIRVTNVVEDIEVLRKKCSVVEKIDENIINTLDIMLDTMYKNRGIGLAANQIGLSKRMVVIDLQENDEKNPIYLINPEIVWKSEETCVDEEGCLSVPFAKADVKRFKQVKVKYLDKEGKEQLVEADGLFAVCLQHEIDHLNGILYIDYLTKLKRDNIIRKIKKELKH